MTNLERHSPLGTSRRDVLIGGLGAAMAATLPGPVLAASETPEEAN